MKSICAFGVSTFVLLTLIGLSASAQTYSPAVAPQDTPEAQAAPFTGTFSNGVKVELIGISTNPSFGGAWWTPDGMVMKERPYEQKQTIVKLEERQMGIEICWRWIGLADADRAAVKLEFSPSAKATEEIVPTGADGHRLSDIQAAAVALPLDDGTLIRFSVPIRGAAGREPAVESIEFRGVRLQPGNIRGVRVMRVSADGKEERLPAAGVTKAALEQERNSPAYKQNEERYKKEQAFEKALGETPGYRLAAGERFKHAPPPFSAARQEYWSQITTRPGQEPEPPRSGFMLFQWVNGVPDWKSATYSAPTIGRLLDSIFKIKSHRIEGGKTLLATELPGDWTLAWDPNAASNGDPKGAYVATPDDIEAFERILQNELLEVVDLELREVKRPVYVVKGTYKYTAVPSPDGKNRERRSDLPDEIRILGGPRMRSGSFVSFNEVLERAGESLGTPLIDETTTRPAKPQTEVTVWGPPGAEAKPLDQETIDTVLAGLTTQTGYTFTKEERSVKMLFIKRGVRE